MVRSKDRERLRYINVKILNSGLLASCACNCGKRFVALRNPFGAYATAACQRKGERMAEAAAMMDLTTGRKLRQRLAAANAWAKRLGRSEKTLSIPLAPSVAQVKELSSAVGRFEEFLRVSEEGDRRRARLSRGR